MVGALLRTLHSLSAECSQVLYMSTALSAQCFEISLISPCTGQCSLHCVWCGAAANTLFRVEGDEPLVSLYNTPSMSAWSTQSHRHTQSNTYTGPGTILWAFTVQIRNSLVCTGSCHSLFSANGRIAASTAHVSSSQRRCRPFQGALV